MFASKEESHLEFDDEKSVDPSDVLLCPRCGEAYLHQEEVFVGSSAGVEGGPYNALMVTSKANAVNVGRVDRLPSYRSVVEISFYCENCCSEERGYLIPYRLRVNQYEGRTFLSWAHCPEDAERSVPLKLEA